MIEQNSAKITEIAVPSQLTVTPKTVVFNFNDHLISDTDLLTEV